MFIDAETKLVGSFSIPLLQLVLLSYTSISLEVSVDTFCCYQILSKQWRVHIFVFY